MCSIFGMNVLDREGLINMGIAGESRGVDATGVATLTFDNKIEIEKEAIRAKDFKWDNVATKSRFFLGHTRRTTQGPEAKNYNNHPFISENGKFTLAHNGVIYNDKEIKKDFDLIDSEIETDSFVAAQLMEHFSEKNKDAKKGLDLSIESVRDACSELSGSFALTIMTRDNHLFLLRHSNPLKVLFTGKKLIYASTTEMIESMINEPEKKFKGLIGNITEDTVYMINLETMEIVDKKSFSAKEKRYKTSCTDYYSYNNDYYSYNNNNKNKKKRLNSKKLNSKNKKKETTTFEEEEKEFEKIKDSLDNMDFKGIKEYEPLESEKVGKYDYWTNEKLKEYVDLTHATISDELWENELRILKIELFLTDSEAKRLNDIRNYYKEMIEEIENDYKGVV